MPKNKKNTTQLHCPVEGCYYFETSERHFTSRKFLNQHIAKVHADKKYLCSKCNKGFGLEWWKKHHEKTCGVEWKCECGRKYSSRETLLTHARRQQHVLPNHILHIDKKKLAIKAEAKPVMPIIVVVQPVIQKWTFTPPIQTCIGTTRQILPKKLAPIEASAVNVTPQQSLWTASSEICSTEFLQTSKQVGSNVSQKTLQTAVAQTQTSDDLVHAWKPRQSRASQCSGRASKSLNKINSTHTQTAESTVVKMKKKNSRSRRKSVAITTESNMLTNTGSSLWPNFKDLIFQPDRCKSTTSTQTSTGKAVSVCDSHTITDDEFLGSSWKDTRKDMVENFEILSEIAAEDSLANLPNTALQDLNMISNASSFCIENNANKMELNTNNVEETNSMFTSVFDGCSKTGKEKVSPPISLNMYTQTMASAVLDYNLLANMETQTTDNFSFADLEFLDTETQTPWDDLPNIEESPLPIDQLSIEIQTDFSSFDSANQDPYDLINGMDMRNIINAYSNKETLGVNTETQTHDQFKFPEFTNSESQTLDISSIIF